MSDFLSRWSRRKVASRAGQALPEAPAPLVPSGEALPTPAPRLERPVASTPPVPSADALPPLESLTPESDFAPFMQEGVDGSVRRAALKTLFADPRFNVMDGLDVYIDDYSKPDPLPEGWLEQLKQVERLGHWQPPAEPAAAEPAEAAGMAGAELVARPEIAAPTEGEAAPPQDSASPPIDPVRDA